MVLFPGATKKEIANVSHMSNFMCFDVDVAGWTIDRLQTMIHGLTHIIYTTTLSTRQQQRWRIILTTSREMTTVEYIAAWHWVNHYIFLGDVDPKTKNVNRLSYMPATWSGGDNLFFNQLGTDLNIDVIMQQAIQQDAVPDAPQLPVQLAQLTGKQTDKTIITANMEAVYRAKNKGGRLYDMMCSAAKRHKINGWSLNAHDLADAALQVSRAVEPNLRRPNILGEAAKAIGWADTNITTLSEMDKLRARMQWASRNNFKEKT